jgi:acyl-coenzyme A synthetase/AMP-(fatty) acid ligase
VCGLGSLRVGRLVLTGSPAGRIVEEGGSERAYSYADLRRRSNQHANWLRGHGVQQSDPVMLMLDNQVERWESILIEHPAVLEAVVVGAPDETRLNITKAYIALAASWDPTDETPFAVLRHARVALAPHTRVRWIEFFELPKTASGKIRRVELCQREIDAAAVGIRIDTEWREEDAPTSSAPEISTRELIRVAQGSPARARLSG